MTERSSRWVCESQRSEGWPTCGSACAHIQFGRVGDDGTALGFIFYGFSIENATAQLSIVTSHTVPRDVVSQCAENFHWFIDNHLAGQCMQQLTKVAGAASWDACDNAHWEG